MASELWTGKYSPRNYGEFVGNPEIVDYAKAWAKIWASGKKEKPLLLYGQTGAGKTCLAYLIARLNDWTVFELNASDFRTKEVIEKLAGAASQNASFSGKPRLILIDEVDGVQGSADRGGLAAIGKILKETQNPVILTANDIYANRNLSTLRFSCKALEFKKINYLSIAKRAKEILDAEKISYDPDAIKEHSKNSSGDFRSVLLDMQTLSSDEKITMKSIESLGYRERTEKIFKILMDIFKGNSFADIRKARMSSEISPELLFRWIEENIPRHFKHSEDCAAAFERLSRADIFNGRIMRRQHWGFLRYSSELMTSGVALSRSNECHGFIPYQFPTLLSKLSKSKSVRTMKKELARKIGKKTHSSAKEVMAHDFPYLPIFMSDKENASGLAATFDLTDEEVAYLLNTKPETKKVKTIIENAEKIKMKFLSERRRPNSPLMQHEDAQKPEEAVPEALQDDSQTKLF